MPSPHARDPRGGRQRHENPVGGRSACPPASPTISDELRLKRVDAEDLYEAMDYLVERESAVEYRLAKSHLREGATVLCDMTSCCV